MTSTGVMSAAKSASESRPQGAFFLERAREWRAIADALRARGVNEEDPALWDTSMAAQVTAMMVVSLLFLAVCALNLMGLLLAKFLARAPEIGVRRALGASRRHVFVQHVVEAELGGPGAKRVEFRHRPGQRRCRLALARGKAACRPRCR